MPLTGWTYHRPLTDGNSTSLANFVTRVALSSANFDFTLAKSDGSDLRVRDETAGATVPHWLSDYDPVAQTGVLFFKATSTANAHNLCYGNPAASNVSTFKGGSGVFTDGTGFDADWGGLSTSVSGAGAATRRAATTGITDPNWLKVFTRSTVATIPTTQWANRPVVREFAILTDRFGKVVQVAGKYYAFYIAQNTVDPVTYPGQTYRCETTDLTARPVVWTNHTLILSAGPGTYDDRGARVASAIQVSSTDYRIYYTNNGTVAYGGGTSGVSVATSTDFATWTKSGSNPILTNANCGITDVAPSLSGVPFVVKLRDDSLFVMLCESRQTTGLLYPWKVYGWTSTDGYTWSVLNGGNPLIAASNGLTTWGAANPKLWQRGTADFVIIAQGFNGSSADLTTFNGEVGIWTSTTLSSTFAFAAPPVAGRINVGPSNFGTEAGGLALYPDGTPILHIQDYPAPDNLNTLSNIYRIYPVTDRLGVFATEAAADASLASMTIASGNFTLENRGNLTTIRSGDNTTYQLGVADSTVALTADTSTNNVAKFRVAIRQGCFSTNQSTSPSGIAPGDISFLYWDTGGTIHYFNGGTALWGTTSNDHANTATVDTTREVIFRIDDDGTNFVFSARYADNLTLIATASIAKSSVKAFSNSRVAFAGVPFTNTNYGGAYSRRISVRPYAATEPAMSLGAQVQDAATWYTIATPSPSSGFVGQASGNFTVSVNAPASGTVTLTPSGGGLSNPIVLTFSGASPQQFTITPTVAGTVTLIPSNSMGLPDVGAVTYAANPATAPATTTKFPIATSAFQPSNTSLGYTLYRTNGQTVIPLTSAGIISIGNLFVAEIDLPIVGSYVVDWFDGITHDAYVVAEFFVEPGLTFAQAMTAILAAATSKTTGGGLTFYAPDGVTPRLVGTVASGERTSSTLLPPN